MASYQQTYNEMGRGERFVQDFLLAPARARWLVSLPLAALSAASLLVLFLTGTSHRRASRGSASRRPRSTTLSRRSWSGRASR
jgi:zinc/manganese transport system permease protein